MPDLDPMLIERARTGDEHALAELFRAHEPRMLRLVELRLDPRLRRRLDPVDVVQDTWLEVSRRAGEWRAGALPFALWLRLIAVQALVTMQRRHLAAHMRDARREVAMQATRSSVSAAALADAFVDSATSPTQVISREELRARVSTALAELDEIDREIVAMRHFEGLSNEEAAAELGIEPSAASMRFLRALARLRPALRALDRRAGGGA